MHAVGTPGCKCMKQNLGIRLGAEAIAFRLEFVPQFAEVVDLAIISQYVAVARVHHRLMAARAQINDAKPIVTHRETSGRVNKASSIIRPAMDHRGPHPIDRCLMKSGLGIYQPAANRAHSTALRSTTLDATRRSS